MVGVTRLFMRRGLSREVALPPITGPGLKVSKIYLKMCFHQSDWRPAPCLGLQEALLLQSKSERDLGGDEVFDNKKDTLDLNQAYHKA